MNILRYIRNISISKRIFRPYIIGAFSSPTFTPIFLAQNRFLRFPPPISTAPPPILQYTDRRKQQLSFLALNFCTLYIFISRLPSYIWLKPLLEFSLLLKCFFLGLLYGQDIFSAFFVLSRRTGFRLRVDPFFASRDCVLNARAATLNVTCGSS